MNMTRHKWINNPDFKHRLCTKCGCKMHKNMSRTVFTLYYNPILDIWSKKVPFCKTKKQ